MATVTDDWVIVAEYPNASSAEVASGLLASMSIQSEILPVADSLTSGGECCLSVPSELADEAKRILSESSVSDSELTELALKDPPPDDA
jgi:hypothetical protein